MENYGPENCTLESTILSNGSEVCQKGKCVVCENGNWVTKVASACLDLNNILFTGRGPSG